MIMSVLLLGFALVSHVCAATRVCLYDTSPSLWTTDQRHRHRSDDMPSRASNPSYGAKKTIFGHRQADNSSDEVIN